MKFEASGYTSHDNLQFLMFENFNLNKKNFIDELKIVKIAQKNKNELSILHQFFMENLNNFKARKLEPYLPLSSFNLIKRYLQFSTLIQRQSESLVQV